LPAEHQLQTCEEKKVSDKVYNVLFICTGNSARSILAEAILNQLGAGHFRAYSAGSFPKGEVHPLTLEILKERDYDVSTLRSKSWDEYSRPDAPKMDFIFTVCDNAGGEACPLWPGQPVTAHWGFPDPAAVEGTRDMRKAAFAKTFREISQRLRIFLNLPFEKLDRMSVQQQLRNMGEQQ
jgi:arsenate reductase (thioredoxin)